MLHRAAAGCSALLVVAAVLSAGTATATAATATAVAPAAVAPAPSAPGDFLEVTSTGLPPSATRPTGSLVARAGEASLMSGSPADLRLRARDAGTGTRVALSFAAPGGKAFAPSTHGGRTYPLAPVAGRGVAVFQATVGRAACQLQSGELTVYRVVSAPTGITGFQGSYQVSCQAGWQLRGTFDLGIETVVRYGETLATPLGTHGLGALPVGSTTRVVLPFTYHGVPSRAHFPAGTVTVVPSPTPGAGGYTVEAAPDAPVVAATCAAALLTEGDVCTVTVEVTPSRRGAANFVVRLGASIGGYAAYSYQGVAASA